MAKPTVLIIVDALDSEAVTREMRAGNLPNFTALAERGQFRERSIAIFPSITPAATSSLVTGVYPRDHGVFGAYWYDQENDEVVYYADDFWVILSKGIRDFFEDFLFQLNHSRLGVPTLFGMADDAHLRTCSINYLIYRGNHAHEVDVPGPTRIVPGVPSTMQILGPDRLFLGDFVSETDDDVESDTLLGAIGSRIGLEDARTGEVLCRLARRDELPDFTLAYFPDNDWKSHEVGALEAVECLHRVDDALGAFFEACGGIDAALERYALVVTGDHSQGDVMHGDSAGVNLQALLSDFDPAPAGEPLTREDDFVICTNLRAAQLYFGPVTADYERRVASRLLEDERVDQVLMIEEPAGTDFRPCRVMTSRGELRFWQGDDGPGTARDRYGGVWSWEGDLSVVDGRVEGGEVRFPTYPNAFERIMGCVQHEGSADLWVTAKIGYEFEQDRSMAHYGGGTHGSLHVEDSVSPLFVAGAESDLQLPEQTRSVDIAPICQHLLGIELIAPIGASRAGTPSDLR